MSHFMFNDTSLSGEHSALERIFRSTSECKSMKPGEVETGHKQFSLFLTAMVVSSTSPFTLEWKSIRRSYLTELSPTEASHGP